MCVCGALLHRQGGGGEAAGGSQGEHLEGPREAWKHMQHDLQDPHQWDRQTEERYERYADGSEVGQAPRWGIAVAASEG